MREHNAHIREVHPDLYRKPNSPKHKPTNGSGPSPAGSTPAYPASFATPRILIDPVVHLHYRTWQEYADYKGTFEQYIYECSALMTKLMGLVPTGYQVKEEEETANAN